MGEGIYDATFGRLPLGSRITRPLQSFWLLEPMSSFELQHQRSVHFGQKSSWGYILKAISIIKKSCKSRSHRHPI
ncbi:hypothetical protein UPYG_G00337190 [Umbra pygmaea]|uniref:Uncharacterized protein n=1 Tax=Umbra pygmaea TaxID=75934 RepID=A0ABD0VXI1_UMBPY